jgi:hypothetical protein
MNFRYNSEQTSLVFKLSEQVQLSNGLVFKWYLNTRPVYKRYALSGDKYYLKSEKREVSENLNVRNADDQCVLNVLSEL